MADFKLSPEDREDDIKTVDYHDLLRSGDLDLKKVWHSHYDAIQEVPVREVLEALPGWDERKADALMHELDIMGGVRVKDLDEHQVKEILKRVGEK